jgi:hypothetical protein
MVDMEYGVGYGGCRMEDGADMDMGKIYGTVGSGWESSEMAVERKGHRRGTEGAQKSKSKNRGRVVDIRSPLFGKIWGNAGAGACARLEDEQSGTSCSSCSCRSLVRVLVGSGMMMSCLVLGPFCLALGRAS